MISSLPKETSEPKKILVVDDHPLFLEGLEKHLIHLGFSVTSTLSSKKALELIKNNDFDIMLFDLKMPELNGIDLTIETQKTKPNSKIIIITGEDIDLNYNTIIKTNIVGIIDKKTDPNLYKTFIELALKGFMVLPLEVTKRLVYKPIEFDPSDDTIDDYLTPEEIEILNIFKKGKTTVMVADELNKSPRAIEMQLTKIYKKLRVVNRNQALTKAIRLNLINP